MKSLAYGQAIVVEPLRFEIGVLENGDVNVEAD